MKMNIALIIILFIVAYLLGSIPSAVWIGKRYYGIDVREHGSKNAGATNTLRVLGSRAAVPVFIIDVLKGYLAVSLAMLTDFDPVSAQMFNLKMALCLPAVLGHIFPVFAGFRGGKGVATMAGAVLGVYPAAVLLCLIVFVIVFMVSHYVSLGSMTAAVMLPICVIFVYKQTYLPLIIFSCVIAVAILLTHIKNIKRLVNGTENKIYIWQYKDSNSSNKES